MKNRKGFVVVIVVVIVLVIAVAVGSISLGIAADRETARQNAGGGSSTRRW